MRRKKIIIAVVLAMVIGFVYFRWASAIRQPLDFSHPQHVKAGIACSTCHPSGSLETLPSTVECKECHKNKPLPSHVQWVPVYRVAPDILFAHSKHPSVPCSTCHQQFTSAKRWVHESRFKMSFCMDCHEDTGASNTCKTCHKNR